MSKLVAKNAMILTAVEIISKALEFIGVVLVARLLGVEQYGLLTFVYSIGLGFSLVAHFGFDNLVTRDLAQDQSKTGEYLKGIIAVKLLLSVAALLVLACWLEGFSHFSVAKKILLYLGTIAAIFTTNNLFTAAVFRAHQQAKMEALLRIILAVLLTVVTILAAWLSDRLLHLIFFRLLVVIVFFILSLSMIVKYLKPTFKKGFGRLQTYLKKGWPFAVYMFFIYIYVSIDVVMLNLMAGNHATGIYSAGTRLLVAFFLIPTGICNAVLPALSARSNQDRSGYARIVRMTFRYLTVLALLLFLFTTTLGRQVVVILFGSEYGLSGDVLALLGWTLFPAFINQLLNIILISDRREKAVVIFSAIGAAMNVTLNFVLIPHYSYFGAVWATLATELVVGASQLIYLKRTVLKPVKGLAASIWVVALAIFIAFLIKTIFGHHLIIGFVMGTGLLVSLLFGLNYIDRKNLQMVYQAVMNRLHKKG